MERILSYQRDVTLRQIDDLERHVTALDNEREFWITQRDFLHEVPGLSAERLEMANMQIHSWCILIDAYRELINLHRDRLTFTL